jgi:hypothetical protein
MGPGKKLIKQRMEGSAEVGEGIHGDYDAFVAV